MIVEKYDYDINFSYTAKIHISKGHFGDWFWDYENPGEDEEQIGFEDSGDIELMFAHIPKEYIKKLLENYDYYIEDEFNYDFGKHHIILIKNTENINQLDYSEFIKDLVKKVGNLVKNNNIEYTRICIKDEINKEAWFVVNDKFYFNYPQTKI